MIRNKIKILTGCFLFSVLSILILAVLGNDQRPNGFNRRLVMDAIDRMNDLDIKYNSFYFAGITSKQIYLGNFTSPLHLLKLNHSLSDTHHINIVNPNTTEYRLTHITVDSPNIFVADE